MPASRQRILHGGAPVWWVAGMVAVFLPLFIYWLAVGALPEMFRQLVAFPFTTYTKTSALPFLPFTAARDLRERAIAAFYYIPPAVSILMAIWLVRRFLLRRFSLSDVPIAFILLWSVLYYLQGLVRSDPWHLTRGLAPFYYADAPGVSFGRPWKETPPAKRRLLSPCSNWQQRG